MIVDRYHWSLSKIRPNKSLAVSLTVTMETEPMSMRKAVTLTPSLTPRKSISFPEPTCLLVTVLVMTKRYVGSGNKISAKVRESMCVENAFVSFLRPPNNNEIRRSQCVSLEYFLRKANVSRRCKLKSVF